jgi:hypothetical protein
MVCKTKEDYNMHASLRLFCGIPLRLLWNTFASARPPRHKSLKHLLLLLMLLFSAADAGNIIIFHLATFVCSSRILLLSPPQGNNSRLMEERERERERAIAAAFSLSSLPRLDAAACSMEGWRKTTPVFCCLLLPPAASAALESSACFCKLLALNILLLGRIAVSLSC